LNTTGAGSTRRITYAATSRLDGIGWCAIGDMISSAVMSSVWIAACLTAAQYPDLTLSPLLRSGASRARCKSKIRSRIASAGWMINPRRGRPGSAASAGRADLPLIRVYL
jgi:hypothetical protein